MEPKLPPLPLDLDTSPARMSIQIKAGELVRLLHQWGREVYAAGQAAPQAPTLAHARTALQPASQPSAGQVDERAGFRVKAYRAADLGLTETVYKTADVHVARAASARPGSNHDIADRLSLWLSTSMDDHLRQEEYRKHIRAWLEFDGNGDRLRAQ